MASWNAHRAADVQTHLRELGKNAEALSLATGLSEELRGVVMNIDDLLCVGVTKGVILSSTINRNAKAIPGAILAELIHGTEDAGLAILDRLSTMSLPAGIDLWLMPEMNPDGYVLRQRGNANGVDLNRNFPTPEWQKEAEDYWGGEGK